MELIDGQSLKSYAEARQLSVRQCLELVVKICDAVHHAHQRGLIHRDLKPGNVMVDNTGQPKILDFGVARLTDSDTQAATRQTELGQLVGTLAYMSPEQVMGDRLSWIRGATSLGVILYELLAGRMPYNIDGQLHQVVQAIREEDPSPLSSINRMYHRREGPGKGQAPTARSAGCGQSPERFWLEKPNSPTPIRNLCVPAVRTTCITARWRHGR
jgi:serine/threonine protein kinase